MQDFSVSIVVFATDENKSLIKTVEYLNEECSYTPDKVILVLSRNATEECVSAAASLKKRYKNTDVTVQDKDGFGCAVVHGINQVETSHLILFPADLAIELSSIERMISEGMKNPEAVIKTSRWLNEGSFIDYNKTRLFFNRIAQGFLRLLFSSSLTDLTNPVQLISTEFQKSVIWKEKGFGILIEQTLLPVRAGMSVREIPSMCFSRSEGKSDNSPIKTFMYIKTALRIRLTPQKKLYK